MLSSGYFPDNFSFSTSTHVPNAKSHGSEDNHTGECKDVQHRKVFQPSPEDLGFCHRLIPSLLLAVKNIPNTLLVVPHCSVSTKIILYEYICPSSSNYRTSNNTDDKSWIHSNCQGIRIWLCPTNFSSEPGISTGPMHLWQQVWYHSVKAIPLRSSSWVASSVALPDGAEDEVFPPTEWAGHLLWVKYVKHIRYGSINVQ